MIYPILLGHLYQNNLSKRIIITIEDRDTYIIAKSIDSGKTYTLERGYMFHNYSQLSPSSQETP